MDIFKGEMYEAVSTKYDIGSRQGVARNVGREEPACDFTALCAKRIRRNQ